MNITKCFTYKLLNRGVAVSILLTTMVTSSAVLSDTSKTQFTEISNELEIMDSVLTTSLRQSNKDQAIKFSRLETSYLAKQGAVFTIDTSNSSFNFRISTSSGFPTMVAPSPPLPPVKNERFFSEHADVATMVEQRFYDAQGRFSESSAKLREVTAAARDLSSKLREFEREKRDLSFELRNADSARNKEIEIQLAALKKQQAKLKDAQDVQAKQVEKVQKEREEQRKAQLAEAEKANKEFLTVFEQSVAGNLCRFGAGLRALPSNQNITFILERFNLSSASDRRDRIYVFSASDVKKCVQEKINESTLLANATVYDF
ncbi:MAG: hypothetical protein ACI96N_001629 [Arenicella sp.]|jgi:hypothetical protein